MSRTIDRDAFANLADTKEVEKQVELFLPDGKLEFQIGFDGEIHEIICKR